MGREVKRVPLDFEWPLNDVWQGFVLPESLRSLQCKQCGGDGLSEHGKVLRDRWYGNAPFKPEDRGSVSLRPDDVAVWEFAKRNVDGAPNFYGTGSSAILSEAERLCRLWNGSWSHHLSQNDVDALCAAGRLMDMTHEWVGPGQPRRPTGRIPTAKEVNDWSLIGFGHDGINQYIVCKAEAERLGCDPTCAACGGTGEQFRDHAHHEAHDAWAASEPPPGSGWQMWETTSEGSPMSPVFDAPEPLARWLADTGASAFGSSTAAYHEWLRMIVGPGWAVSAVAINGVLQSGVAAS